MTDLFSPIALRDLTLRNRTVVAPMCQYSAIDGMANDWHFAHLARFGIGGFGLVIVEATGVVPEGRISYGDLGLWRDEQIAPSPASSISFTAKAPPPASSSPMLAARLLPPFPGTSPKTS